MRQLLPTPIDDVDPVELYLADERRASAGRPWLMCNMIASTDGATTRGGLSGALGGPGDKAVFRALRASCDWVLVASGTAVAETYRVPSVAAEVARQRAARGRPDPPRLAIVTASGEIDASLPAFTRREPDEARPLIITGTDADDERLAALDAEVVRLGTQRPEPLAILTELGTRGAAVVLSEGGPTFNGLLQAAGLIDELCLSISPLLVGGSSARIVAGAADGPVTDLRLDRLLDDDGTLFARYVRA